MVLTKDRVDLEVIELHKSIKGTSVCIIDKTAMVILKTNMQLSLQIIGGRM